MARTSGPWLDDTLRIDDALAIEGERYQVRGCVTLATPDGDRWNEWLLAPATEPVDLAIAQHRQRWLSFDDGEAWLWTPVSTPPDKVVTRFEEGDSLTFDGLRYRVVDSDQARVQQLRGDTGADYRVGDSFPYLELIAGQRAMTIEWGDGDIDACLGECIDEQKFLQWAQAAGTDLRARRSRPAPGNHRERLPEERRGVLQHFRRNGVSLLCCALLGLPLLALSGCDDDDDCYRRYNKKTQQYERHCDGGLRHRSSRSYGGWGGK